MTRFLSDKLRLVDSFCFMLQTRVLDVGQLDYIVTGLEADTLYTMYIISVNNHGASQPSYKLQAATHPRKYLLSILIHC